VDLGTRNYISNTYESFDLIKFLDKTIKVANRSFMRIMGQGFVKLFCRRLNKASPFILLLENVYFIPECTVNLVFMLQLGIDSIAFDLETPCLKAFGLTKVLCFISQINCYYVLNVVPRPETVFIESIDPIYLILSLLEHSLLLWHQRLGHTSLGKIR
jgi:hypothetical protein